MLTIKHIRFIVNFIKSMRNKKGQFVKGHKHKPEEKENIRKKLMGNNYGTKLKSPEIRQDAYRQYCEHLAKGKSQESFYFDHPEFTVTYKTMNRYIAENPSEFPAIKKEIAEIKSFAHWENIIEEMIDGKKKAETALIQMVMRNKFGWDKENKDNNGNYEPEVRVLLKKFDEIKINAE